MQKGDTQKNEQQQPIKREPIARVGDGFGPMFRVGVVKPIRKVD